MRDELILEFIFIMSVVVASPKVELPFIARVDVPVIAPPTKRELEK